MELSVKNLGGQVVRTIEVSDAVFGGRFRPAVVHQMMVGHLANRRAGTHSTKTRAEVRGGGRKPWRQKGTGRARQGSIRSPQWRGGGVVMGPKPRDYSQRLPKKMRRLAIRSLLAQRVREDAVTVVEDLSLLAPRTKEVIGVLETMGISRKCLLVTGDSQPEMGRACRNLPRVKSLPADTINTLDLLNHDHVLLSVAAVRRIEELWAEERPRLPARRAAVPVAAEASDEAPAAPEETPAVEDEAAEAQE